MRSASAHYQNDEAPTSPMPIITSELAYQPTFEHENGNHDSPDNRSQINEMGLFQTPSSPMGRSMGAETGSSYTAAPESNAPGTSSGWQEQSLQSASSQRLFGAPHPLPPASMTSTFSFRTVDHYQALREMNPFSLKGEFFHVMISHRVSSEGAEGSGVSGHLFKELVLQSLQHSSKSLGLGKYPQFSRRRSSTEEDGYFQGLKTAGVKGSTVGNKDKETHPKVKVFLDEECLPEGERWKESFLLGLAHSMVFVPLLSWKSNHTGSIGQLSSMSEDAEVDHVLLELIVALELCLHGGSAVKTIFPVFVGEVIKVQSKRTSSKGGEVTRVHVFKPAQIDKLPDIIPKKTNDEAALVLEALGVSVEQIEEMRCRTLRDTLKQILDFQGIRLDADTKLSKAVTVVAKRILETVERTLEKEQAKAFEESRPQAHEVLTWLRQKSLAGYAQAFAQHGLDSLHSVSELTEEQIHAFFRSDSPLCTTNDHFANLGNCLRLCIAVRDLKFDDRARPLAERLHMFKDKTVSSLTAMVTANGLEIVLSKPICQALAAVLSACGLVGSLLGIAIIARDGLPGIAGNSPPPDDEDLEESDPRDPYPYVGQYSSVVNLMALTGAGILGLVALWQAKYLSPYYGKQTVWWLLLQAFLLCLLGFGLDVLQAIEYNREHGIFRVWFVGFSFGFMLTLGVLLLTFLFSQRLLPTAFLLMVGMWSLVLGVLKVTLPDFDDVSTALPVTAGGALLSGCVCLGVIVVLYFLYRHGLTQIDQLAREIQVTFAPTWAEIEREERADLESLCKTCEKITSKLQEEIRLERSFWRTIAEEMGLVPSKAIRRSWDGKYRQKWDDMDTLFGHAAHINKAFSDSIQTLCHQCGLGTLQAGHIKHADRAIQKTVRTYFRDPSCLTDIVRCRVLFTSVMELNTWIEHLLKHAQVGFSPDKEEPDGMHRARKRRASLPVNAWRERPLQALAASDPTSVQKLYRITALKNRFEAGFDISSTAGYRDVSFNVEVGWLSEGGSVQFLPVEAWNDAGAELHICEVQLHIAKMHLESTRTSTHNKYVKWRNLLTR